MRNVEGKANITRGTPGMILLAFATLLLAAALMRTLHAAPRDHLSSEFQPLTGLGDTTYYTNLSPNDFYAPALVFEAAPRGLFRRTVNPVTRPDARMARYSVDASGRVIVYTEIHLGAAALKQLPTRWFLKSGPNLYVEFGDRKFWPAYKSRR